MEPEVAISFLSSWIPASFNQDFDGQANALANLIRMKPDYFAGYEKLLSTIRPEYCCSIAYAWYGLACQDKPIPKTPALRFCLEICEKPFKASTIDNRESLTEGERSSWVATLTLMLHIVESLSDDTVSIESFKNQLFDAFRNASTAPEAHDAKEHKIDDNNPLPLAIALNAVPTLGFRGLMAWTKAFHEGPANPELERSVKQSVHAAECSVAMSAQIGECVGMLSELGFDCPAIMKNLVDGKEGSESHQVFVTTILALYRPHPELLSLIRPGI